VEFYELFRWGLVLVVSVTVPFPVNVPLAALAYKVRLGPDPVPLDPGPFWLRSALAAFLLAALGLATTGADYLLVRADVPAGVVHMALLLAVVPAGVWLLASAFELEDLLQGLSVFVIYVFLPGLPLLMLAVLFHWPLLLGDTWLAPLPSGGPLP
jgi:hypothetical protein